MLNNMKIGTKIAVGFILLIIITVALGGLAVKNMNHSTEESAKLAREYAPEVDAAMAIHIAANRIMYNMRGYGFTEEKVYYERAVKAIQEMEAGIAKGHTLSENAKNLKQLSGHLNTIDKALQEYKAAIGDTHATVTHLKQLRQALDRNALIYMQSSESFVAGQNEAFERDLATRLEKIDLATHLVEHGNTARVLNFKGQADNKPALMQDAIDTLDDINKIAKELRLLTHETDQLQLIDDTVTSAAAYQGAIRSFLDEYRKGGSASRTLLAQTRLKMDASAKNYMDNCDQFLSAQQKKLVIDMTERNQKINLAGAIVNLGNDTRVKAFKSQALRDPQLILDAQKNFDLIDQKFEQLKKITHLTEDLKLIESVQAAAKGYEEALGAFLEDWRKLQDLGRLRNSLADTMLGTAEELTEAGLQNTLTIAEENMTTLHSSSYVLEIGLVAATILGVLLAFFITRGITRAVTRIVDGLNESAVQVAAAAGQVSSSSQQLAEGSSEQAASIEETSSSLEEVSSMTRQNADNAQQADGLMKEANQVVQQADEAMNRLTASMSEISSASEETSKIIKTIDEIAFQTNLLALNAAVEAARAGEAGAGFAVVADEVRNLAMRAAEAAKSTADLIESTVKRVNDGSELVSRTNETFVQVAQSSKKVGELVSEIAAASNEQAQGIGQVNTAVNQMDKVVQLNAANAEESAGASEEMNAQAEQMKSIVQELVAMVGGSVKHNGGSAFKTKRTSAQWPGAQIDRPAAAVPPSKLTEKQKVTPRKKEVPPEEMIPLDDDFTDF